LGDNQERDYSNFDPWLNLSLKWKHLAFQIVVNLILSLSIPRLGRVLFLFLVLVHISPSFESFCSFKWRSECYQHEYEHSSSVRIDGQPWHVPH
jgi:hypothetical protein